MSDGKPNLASVKVLAGGMCVFVLLAVLAAFTFWKAPLHERLPLPVRESAARGPSPSLYCLFSDFTHASVVVGFDFAVALPKDAPPRFAERAEAVRNDPAVNFDADNQPAWSYAVDEDGTPTISSPDGATRILLYGLKLGTGDVFWIEAGIRSNTFRNLDGKCLQSHFDDVGHKSVTSSTAR